MPIKIQAVVAATALLLASGSLVAQANSNSAPAPSTTCKHCDRPTPFGQTQGISVIVMVRDAFAKSSMAAVVRDEPGASSKPLVAIKRSAMTPAIVYRALTSVSIGRTKHNGPPLQRETEVLSSSAAFQPVPDEDAAWVAQLIKQLSAAPETSIAGIGRFPAITLTLDKKTLRGK